MRLPFLFILSLIIFSCSMLNQRSTTLAKADPDYMKSFTSFENIDMNTNKDLENIIVELKNIENIEYAININANGIISAKLLIDKIGNVKDIYIYNNFDDQLTNEVIKNIKNSKFKSINAKEYAIIITYRFNNGEILCPLINGAPFPDSVKCNYKNPIFFFEADLKPVIINRLVAIYPDSDRMKGNEGVTVTTVTIDHNGFVEYAQNFKSISNSLDQASIDAAMKFKFNPGEINNEKVKVKMNIPFHFALK